MVDGSRCEVFQDEPERSILIRNGDYPIYECVGENTGANYSIAFLAKKLFITQQGCA